MHLLHVSTLDRIGLRVEGSKLCLLAEDLHLRSVQHLLENLLLLLVVERHASSLRGLVEDYHHAPAADTGRVRTECSDPALPDTGKVDEQARVRCAGTATLLLNSLLGYERAVCLKLPRSGASHPGVETCVAGTEEDTITPEHSRVEGFTRR